MELKTNNETEQYNLLDSSNINWICKKNYEKRRKREKKIHNENKSLKSYQNRRTIVFEIIGKIGLFYEKRFNICKSLLILEKEFCLYTTHVTNILQRHENGMFSPRREQQKTNKHASAILTTILAYKDVGSFNPLHIYFSNQKLNK